MSSKYLEHQQLCFVPLKVRPTSLQPDLLKKLTDDKWQIIYKVIYPLLQRHNLFPEEIEIVQKKNKLLW